MCHEKTKAMNKTILSALFLWTILGVSYGLEREETGTESGMQFYLKSIPGRTLDTLFVQRDTIVLNEERLVLFDPYHFLPLSRYQYETDIVRIPDRAYWMDVLEASFSGRSLAWLSKEETWLPKKEKGIEKRCFVFLEVSPDRMLKRMALRFDPCMRDSIPREELFRFFRNVRASICPYLQLPVSINSPKTEKIYRGGFVIRFSVLINQEPNYHIKIHYID